MVDAAGLNKAIEAAKARYGSAVIHSGSDQSALVRVPTGAVELDYATGGGIPLGRWAHFYGGFCVSPETKVLRRDYSWANAGDLNEGEELIAFDEFPVERTRGKQRGLRPAVVNSNDGKMLNCVRIVTDKTDTIASNDHMWLVLDARRSPSWKRSENLRVGDRILWFGETWNGVSDRETAAYLAGLFDGEGWVDGARASFAQNPGEIFDKGVRLLRDIGFDPKIRNPSDKSHSAVVGGSNAEMMRFLSHVPSVRLRKNAGDWWVGRCISSKGPWREKGEAYATVSAVEPVGRREVYVTDTSTRTLIADGLYSHNSSAKTHTAWCVVKNAQAMGLTCAYYNVEKTYLKDHVASLGVDVDKLLVVDEATIEGVGTLLEGFLRHVNVHVIDSLAAAVSVDELNSKVEDWHMGLAARTWGKVLRRANERFDDKENMIIMINQVRDAFGYGGGETPPGGRYIEFASSMSLYFRRSKWLFRDKNGNLAEDKAKIETLSGDTEADGIEFQVNVKKSKVCRPLRSARLRFDFSTGEFDNLWSLTKAAIYLKLVKQTGAWYELPNGEKVHGQGQLREKIADDPVFYNAILEKLMEDA